MDVMTGFFVTNGALSRFKNHDCFGRGTTGVGEQTVLLVDTGTACQHVQARKTGYKCHNYGEDDEDAE